MSHSLVPVLNCLASALTSRQTESVLRRIIHAMATWHRRAVARRELRELDDVALRDLGISHREAAVSPCARGAAFIGNAVDSNKVDTTLHEALLVLGVALAAAASATAIVIAPMPAQDVCQASPAAESAKVATVKRSP